MRDELFPVLTVEWVDAGLHAQAFAALIAAGRQSVSLVDHVSFELMRRRGVRRALTVDLHFAAHGFDLVPEASDR
jgi:predicted nucleic acid-binding protein